jgi:hypothetical protein
MFVFKGIKREVKGWSSGLTVFIRKFTPMEFDNPFCLTIWALEVLLCLDYMLCLTKHTNSSFLYLEYIPNDAALEKEKEANRQGNRQRRTHRMARRCLDDTVCATYKWSFFPASTCRVW